MVASVNHTSGKLGEKPVLCKLLNLNIHDVSSVHLKPSILYSVPSFPPLPRLPGGSFPSEGCVSAACLQRVRDVGSLHPSVPLGYSFAGLWIGSSQRRCLLRALLVGTHCAPQHQCQVAYREGREWGEDTTENLKAIVRLIKGSLHLSSLCTDNTKHRQ